MCDVSIIIVNYNTVHLVVNAIRSIYETVSGISYEVIVVDNCSSDCFDTILKQHFDDKVICVALPENIGFGRANNIGIRYASGQNLFFLNPDTILLNDAVTILSDFLNKHSKVGACGGNLYDENMCPTHSFRRMIPSIFSEIDTVCSHKISKWRMGESHEFNHTGFPLKVKYITGADMMVKREVLDRSGLFSPDFFMYFEETELCFRISKLGYTIYSVPEAKIQHLENKSFSDEEKNTRRLTLSNESERVFLSKCYSPFYRKVAKSIQGINIYSRRFLSYTLHLSSASHYKRLWISYKNGKVNPLW